jgi:coproporphyrinogen III oxidase
VRFERIIRDAQNEICDAVSALDGTPFHEDAWTRADGGGGVSRVLQGGNVFEKAGVNVSVVYGSMPASAYRAATERNAAVGPDSERVPFFAAGISSVMHPHNPHAPTMHFNYRRAPRSCSSSSQNRCRNVCLLLALEVACLKAAT